LNPEKIKEINLKNNKLLARDLTCFSNFVNLEKISVDGSFYGSLEPLKNLTKLKFITIAGTNIDRGLEYLPIGVKSTGLIRTGFCPPSLHPSYENLGCKKIFKQLEKYTELTVKYLSSYQFDGNEGLIASYSEDRALDAWRIEN
ncbi:19965_t:CDS:1, partial [Racocetra fulgida]